MAEEEEVAVADETVEEETTPAEGFVTAAAAEEEEDFVAVGGATEIKLFGKWSFDDIEVRDISLVVRENFYTYRTRTKKASRAIAMFAKRRVSDHRIVSFLPILVDITMARDADRITLLARVIMPPTCRTRPDATKRNDSARPLVPSSNAWRVASCARAETVEKNSWPSGSFSTRWKLFICSPTRIPFK